MCVIICKPAGIPMPSKEILKAASIANPDGMGFVSSNGVSCHSMDFDTFYTALCSVDIKEEVLIHMRWGTHGSKTLKNCHPFYDKETDVWFAHNGVLPIASKNDMTDSEICFRERLVPAIKRYGLNSREFDRISNRERGGSRFAYMHNGQIYLQGDFREVDDIYYSNLHFVAYMRRDCELGYGRRVS